MNLGKLFLWALIVGWVWVMYDAHPEVRALFSTVGDDLDSMIRFVFAVRR